MAWILLFFACIAEIIFTLSLKLNQGFTKFWPSVVTVVSAPFSFYLLMLSLKTLPIGTAYAIMTGVSTAAVAIFGIFLFKESTDIYRLASIVLIIIGIIGLKLTHPE